MWQIMSSHKSYKYHVADNVFTQVEDIICHIVFILPVWRHYLSHCIYITCVKTLSVTLYLYSLGEDFICHFLLYYLCEDIICHIVLYYLCEDIICHIVLILPVWRHYLSHCTILPVWRHYLSHCTILPLWRHYLSHCTYITCVKTLS
jgi:hypothetical protein